MLDRRILRERAVKALIGKTSAKVYDSRTTAFDENDLPAVINVATPQQSGQGASGNHLPVFNSTITLNITLGVAAIDGWAGKLDEICEQVESLILRDPLFLGNDFAAFTSYSCKIEDVDDAKPMVSCVMSIEVFKPIVFEPILDDTPAFGEAMVDLKVGDGDKISALYDNNL